MHLSGAALVFGVIGDPIAHSLSPFMQNRALEAMEIDGVYVPFRISAEHLHRAVGAIVAFGIRGLNVTVPHKTAVLPLLDRLTDSARTVGAVNTIINEDGVLVGENTDVYGFEQCVLRGSGTKSFPARICVLGAGGAARGVVYACTRRDEVEEIIVLNRTVSRAAELAGDLAAATGKRIEAAPADGKTLRAVLPSAGMVVNTTTVGMHPDTGSTPVPDPAVFRPGQIVCDIVYTPLRTRFLREAAERGALTVSGLSMLAWQGARSLSLWTGREAPAEVMLEALREHFAGE